jgi:hypothetical protein
MTRQRARSRTEASTRATTLGVNALFTSERSRRCRGSSRVIIDPKYSACSGGVSKIEVLVGGELKIADGGLHGAAHSRSRFSAHAIAPNASK